MKEKAVIIGLIFFIFGIATGAFLLESFYYEKQEEITPKKEIVYQADHEELVIEAVEKALPSVVSIVIKKEMDYSRADHYEFFRFYEDFPGGQVGAGTGFFVSSDGVIITNKHVIEEEADHLVVTNEGEGFEAEILAIDPMQDIAFLKVEGENFSAATLGDSSEIRVGQTAIAIGYALAELQNTVSVGVVSGIGRRIEATDGRMMEVLEDIIQTDAGINVGNSGGPLLNLKGEVIGINTAKETRAQNIGFAIPINKAERAIRGAIEEGRIAYPFLGVRYILVNSAVKEERELPVDYGALIVSGGHLEPAIDPGSGAEKAGLREGDIILEFEGEKITTENSLASIIVRYEPEDEVELKIMREGSEKTMEAVLGSREG